MNNKTNFTVVIPLFNNAKQIQDTLKSVLKQSYQPYEIIICDDGSTDGSPLIAEDTLKHSAVSYKIVSQPNSGPSKARNTAVAESTGNWLCFLDADDRWDEGYLGKLEMIIRNYPTDAILTNFIAEQSFGNSRNKFEHAPENFWQKDWQQDLLFYNANSDDLFLQSFIFQPGIPSALAVSQKAYLKLGGFRIHSRSLKSEDYHFLGRLYASCDIILFKQPMVYKKNHAGNRSKSIDGSQDWISKLKGRINILELFLSDIAFLERNYHQQIRNEIELSKRYLFNQLFWTKNYTLACAYYQKNGMNKNYKLRLKFFISYLLKYTNKRQGKLER